MVAELLIVIPLAVKFPLPPVPVIVIAVNVPVLGVTLPIAVPWIPAFAVIVVLANIELLLVIYAPVIVPDAVTVVNSPELGVTEPIGVFCNPPPALNVVPKEPPLLTVSEPPTVKFPLPPAPVIVIDVNVPAAGVELPITVFCNPPPAYNVVPNVPELLIVNPLAIKLPLPLPPIIVSAVNTPVEGEMSPIGVLCKPPTALNVVPNVPELFIVMPLAIKLPLPLPPIIVIAVKVAELGATLPMIVFCIPPRACNALPNTPDVLMVIPLVVILPATARLLNVPNNVMLGCKGFETVFAVIDDWALAQYLVPLVLPDSM